MTHIDLSVFDRTDLQQAAQMAFDMFFKPSRMLGKFRPEHTRCTLILMQHDRVEEFHSWSRGGPNPNDADTAFGFARTVSAHEGELMGIPAVNRYGFIVSCAGADPELCRVIAGTFAELVHGLGLVAARQPIAA